MEEKEFRKRLSKQKADIVKEFKNSNNEKFILYKYSEMAAYLISGDEFDWEFGWMLQKGDHKEAICIFSFSNEEGQELMNFWNQEFGKEKARFEATHKDRKFTPEEKVDTTKPKEKDESEDNESSSESEPENG